MSVGVVLPNAKVQLFDDNGDPLAGGLLYSYAAGSSTPQNTYSDVGLTTPNANPKVLDAAGRATIYLTPASSYRFLLKDAFGATVWDQDNITVAAVADTVRKIIAGTNITISYTGVDAGTGDVTVNVSAELGGVYTGGIALAGQAIGDLMYASSTVQWARLADVAAGAVLVSGGVGVAPAWSKYPTIAAGTITTSNPVTISQTWNDGAVTFNALLVSVTATASAAASLLLDLQVGAASKFKVDKAGNTVVAGTLTAAGDVGLAATKKLYFDGVAMSGDTYIVESAANTLSLYSGGVESKLVSGVLTVSGFGTHTFSAGGTGGNALTVRNTTAGTGNYAELNIGNDRDTQAGIIRAMSSTYTTSGPWVADGVMVYSQFAGGMSIHAAHASGAIRLYAGGTTRRALYDTDGTVTFDVYGAGTATFSAAGKFSSVSDERLKDITGPLGYGLAEVLALDPIRYFWNGDSGLDDPKHTEYGGFGAGNVKAVMPLAVGMDGRGFLTLADRPILGALVNSTKELNARIVDLEKQVATLQARIH
jgi:hypothetical protein